MTTVTCREFGKPPVEIETGERDPHGIPNNHPGAKADAGKTRAGLCLMGFYPAFTWLFPEPGGYTVLQTAARRWPRALAEVARVTTAGALKYTPNGWLQVPDGANRYLDAWGRHLLDGGKGHTHDDGPGGTGCLHEAQACWNLLAAATLIQIETKWPVKEEALRWMCLGALDGLETALRVNEQCGAAV